ncbi:MAG: HPP family protein [Actinomycetota bacterium]|nr:HPP family protein [Actinomycetota bacterium]MDP9486563.1 HPP family protein [Actinomycetota bacterium]
MSKRSPLRRRSLLDYLWGRFGEQRAMSLFTMVSGFISIVIMAFAAYLTDAPFIFPALGPTIFLIFSRPMSPSASPRNIVLGHLFGCLCGWGSLAISGLLGEESVLTAGVGLPRILAVGLSLSLTSGFLVLFDLDHPPAASTTLIVSLGLMSSPAELAVLMLAVAFITVQAVMMNRRAGFPYPLWKPSRDWHPSEGRTRPPA